MLGNIPTVSNSFILNTAMEEATYILLKPYLTSSQAARFDQVKHRKCTSEYLTNCPENQLIKSRYFLTKMARIAWDFLNVSNIFASSG